MTNSKEFSKKKNKCETVETLEKCKELLNTKIEKATRIAKENTKYNKQGYAVISKDDEWREDNEWNRDYDEEYKSGDVTKALENSFKEVKEHKQGKKKLKTLKECEETWKEWSEE